MTTTRMLHAPRVAEPHTSRQDQAPRDLGTVTLLSRGDEAHVDATGQQSAEAGAEPPTTRCSASRHFVGMLLTQRLMDSPKAPALYEGFWGRAYAT